RAPKSTGAVKQTARHNTPPSEERPYNRSSKGMPKGRLRGISFAGCVMTNDLFAVVKPFIDRIHDRLVSTARSDPVFREQLRELGEYVRLLIAEAAAAPSPPPEQAVVTGHASGASGQPDGSPTPDAGPPTS